MAKKIVVILFIDFKIKYIWFLEAISSITRLLHTFFMSNSQKSYISPTSLFILSLFSLLIFYEILSTSRFAFPQLSWIIIICCKKFAGNPPCPHNPLLDTPPPPSSILKYNNNSKLPTHTFPFFLPFAN